MNHIGGIGGKPIPIIGAPISPSRADTGGVIIMPMSGPGIRADSMGLGMGLLTRLVIGMPS